VFGAVPARFSTAPARFTATCACPRGARCSRSGAGRAASRAKCSLY